MNPVLRPTDVVARGLRLLCCALLALLAAAASCTPAWGARGHVFDRSFGRAGHGEGEFEGPAGVAVSETSGDVFVVDRGNGRVERFTAAGAYLGEFDGSGLIPGEGTPAGGGGLEGEVETGAFSSPTAIAVDNACAQHKPALSEATVPTCAEFDPSAGDVYVVDTGHEVIDKYRVSGELVEYVGQIASTPSGSLGEIEGVAVDGDGRLWVYRRNAQGDGEIDEFGSALHNPFLASIASTADGFAVPGFALDGSDGFYVVHRFVGLVARLDGAGSVLSEEIDGEGATALALEPSSRALAVAMSGAVDVLSSTGAIQEQLGAGILEGADGVAVDAVSETIYVADATKNAVDVFAPQAPSAPTIAGEAVTDVTSSSARLEATVNPDGASTEYRFEYGRCGASGCGASGYETSLPVPDGTLGADFEAHPVRVTVGQLTSSADYHFRLVARNQFDQPTGVAGQERTFTTQPLGGSFVLPDARRWELVSPPDKHGALIETIGEGQVMQTAADGRAISYETVGPADAEAEGYSNLSQELSARTAAGWASHDVSLPHVASTQFSYLGQEYRYFSENLSEAIVQPFGNLIPASSPRALAPQEASEQTAFLRKMYLNGEPGEACASSCYQPLVTAAPGFADVPVGTVFGGCDQPFCGPLFVSATPDLAHVMLRSSVALTTTPLVAGGTALYEWTGGKLSLVSLLPGNEGPALSPNMGYRGKDIRNAISTDGTRVIWSEEKGAQHLYLRDTARQETVQLDQVQGGNGEGPYVPTEFQFASADGSRVFFAAEAGLTSDSEGGYRSPGSIYDLYECTIAVVAGRLTCELSDLTPVSHAEQPKVQGDVMGADETGDRLYYVANGVQAAGAKRGECNGVDSRAGAECNLYEVYLEGSSWKTKFVASLSWEDSPSWNGLRSASELSNVTSRVSPNGRWLAFMSRQDLTGYDTSDAVTGKPDEEVYLYDSQADRLVCASCDPTGARPVGVQYGQMRFGADGLDVWYESPRLAANLPAWTSFSQVPQGTARYQPRYLSNSGRLFFNSSDTLVPADVNGTGDVYEFEPEGVGGCASGLRAPSVEYVAQLDGSPVDGCVGLISSGSSSEEADFFDASENGDDVFFLTPSRLTSQDSDTSLDLYDAHQCTATAPCQSSRAAVPPACDNSDSCKAAPTPQPEIFGAPASSTFRGEGNAAAAKPGPARSSGSARVKRRTKARACPKARGRGRRVRCKGKRHGKGR